MTVSRYVVLAGALTAAVLAGCSGSLTSRQIAEPRLTRLPRVAILPFENLSGQEHAGTKITEYFLTLSAGRDQFAVVPSGTTFDALRRLRIRAFAFATRAELDSLAATLDIDYVLTGAVLEFDQFDDPYLGKVPRVSFSARVVDCRTAQPIWSGVTNSRGDKWELVFGIGTVRSLDDLAERMVEKNVGEIASLFEK